MKVENELAVVRAKLAHRELQLTQQKDENGQLSGIVQCCPALFIRLEKRRIITLHMRMRELKSEMHSCRNEKTRSRDWIGCAQSWTKTLMRPQKMQSASWKMLV
jgi:hypothetical protein